MATSDKVYSYSIFIFPFKFFVLSNGKKLPINPAKVVEMMKPVAQPKAGWSRVAFKVDDPERYAEWQYFHPFVRDMVFQTARTSKKVNLEYLTREDYDELTLEYWKCSKWNSEKEECEKYEKCEPLKVRVRSADLHLYDNQIGLLTITTENDGRFSFNELLKFNDLARRVYPPFLGAMDDDSSITAKPKRIGLLADRISLSKSNNDNVANSIPEEKFPHKTIEEYENYLSDIISNLLKPMEFQGVEESKEDQHLVCYESFTDDRMFLVSYCENKYLAEKLAKKCCAEYAFETDSDWYKFVFVDGGSKGVENTDYQRQLITRHTYPRWADVGTLYGLTRYSFVGLTNGSRFAKENLRIHLRTMYYQIALIILFQRAMLLEFSNRVKNIVDEVREGANVNVDQLVKKVKTLQLDFISFTTKYSFAEVSPQEQGIEIYNQWSKIIELDEHFNEVKGEIDQLADHVQTRVSHETDKSVKDLTFMLSILTWWLFILTVWLVLFGEFVFKGELAELLGVAGTVAGSHPVASWATWGILVLLVGFGLLPFLTRFGRRGKLNELWNLFRKFILGRDPDQ